MQENKFHSSIFLDRLREKLGFKRDTQLADFLGIAQPTISGWRTRNTFDFSLIAEKCIPLGISFDELLGVTTNPKERTATDAEIAALESLLSKLKSQSL